MRRRALEIDTEMSKVLMVLSDPRGQQRLKYSRLIACLSFRKMPSRLSLSKAEVPGCLTVGVPRERAAIKPSRRRSADAEPGAHSDRTWENSTISDGFPAQETGLEVPVCGGGQQTDELGGRALRTWLAWITMSWSDDKMTDCRRTPPAVQTGGRLPFSERTGGLARFGRVLWHSSGPKIGPYGAPKWP